MVPLANPGSATDDHDTSTSQLTDRQTDTQTDRRTDEQTTCDGNTALCVAYRGNNIRGHVRAGPAFSWVHCQHAQNGGALRAAYFDITGAPYHFAKLS